MEVLNTTRQEVRYRLRSSSPAEDWRILPAGDEDLIPESWTVEFYIGSRIVADALVHDASAVIRLVEGRGGYSVEVISSRDPLVRYRIESSRLIESMMPAAVPSAPAVLQARRNALAREALFREFGVLTSAEVADLAGSKASNKAALANRWKQEGKIFSVSHQGLDYFPGYQFDEDGKPLPVIAQVLATLGGQSKGWELALWFTAANGWLAEGRRPVDLLRSEPGEVALAAEREAEGLFF